MKQQTTQMQPRAPDPKKLEAFAGKVVGDLAGNMATVFGILGDRLGLFRTLASGGPRTTKELAKAAGLDERYVREWVHGCLAAGYVTYDAATGRASLSPEQVEVFAHEAGPAFFGGVFQEIGGGLRQLDGVAESFRTGRGLPPTTYAPDFWQGLERFTAEWFENHLVQDWLPRVPAVQAKLASGASVADIGCGGGRALVKLAKAFPRSTFVGYDVHAPSIERARALAKSEGVADRVTFQVADAAKPLPSRFDIITMFDVLHDMAEPRAALKAVRKSLKPGGTFLCLEINCADRPEENQGPVGTLLYGFSVLYCMTSSLGLKGEGLGTMGVTPSVAKALFAEAGFGRSERLDLANPFNVLYVAE